MTFPGGLLKYIGVAVAICSALAAAFAQQPEWQIHARWCIGDPGSSHSAYMIACSKSDQFDSVIACQAHNPGAQQKIREAGRAAVNAFMDPIKPASCKASTGGSASAAGSPAVYPSCICDVGNNQYNALFSTKPFDLKPNKFYTFVAPSCNSVVIACRSGRAVTGTFKMRVVSTIERGDLVFKYNALIVP